MPTTALCAGLSQGYLCTACTLPLIWWSRSWVLKLFSKPGPSCLFRPLNYGWDVSSRGLSPHQVPIRFLSARGTHTAAFLWGPSFFFSLISLVSSWVVALTLISLWPPSFCLRVLYLEFSSEEISCLYMSASISFYGQFIIPAGSLIVTSALPVRMIHYNCHCLPSHQPSQTCFPSAGFSVPSCPTAQCWSPD